MTNCSDVISLEESERQWAETKLLLEQNPLAQKFIRARQAWAKQYQRKEALAYRLKLAEAKERRLHETLLALKAALPEKVRAAIG